MHSGDALLASHPLLAGLTAEQLRGLAALGELEDYAAGDLIVCEGDLGDALFLILSGQTEVVVERRILASLGAGDFFGEMSFLEPVQRSATVRAADGTCVFRLPHVALQRLLSEDPTMFNAVLVRLVRVLSERLRKTNRVLGSVGNLADWLAGSLV